jgi:hypothetical protein
VRLKSILAALILAAMVVGPASAVVLGLDWGTGQRPVTISYFGSSHSVYAGSLKGYLGGQLGDPLPPNDGTYFGDLFCVDLDHTITIPTEYEVQVLTTAALANGGRLAWLYQNNIAEAKNGNIDTAAALQIALWDVVTDGGDGLDTGNFQYVSGLAARSTNSSATMIAESAGKVGEATFLRAVGPTGQSMITIPVPEPGTFGLLGLGFSLISFGFLRKRS